MAQYAPHDDGGGSVTTTGLPSPNRDTSILPKRPYPGLRPFEADEWPIFFGRESMIDDVLDRLGQHRFIVVYGASGAGKSSLILAGVLPRLARQHRRHGVPWLTCSLRPANGPLWNLAKAFARLERTEGDINSVASIFQRLNRRDATISSVVASLPNCRGHRVCILVDQFEELFRYAKEQSRDEAELFVELLVRELAMAGAPDGQEPAHVILTMRSEFLGACARFDGLAEVINQTQYLVPRMDRASLLRAIQRPASMFGGRVTTELAEHIVADVEDHDDELPLIQHGLMLMWDAAKRKSASGAALVMSTYPFGTNDRLADMLSRHADRVVASIAVSGGQQKTIEHVFRALTDINADGQAIRRPQTFRQLAASTGAEPSALRAIIDPLRAEGVSFLTPYAPTVIDDETVIDISHEALIRCWKSISDPENGWLRREFDDGLIWRSLVMEAKAFLITHKPQLTSGACMASAGSARRPSKGEAPWRRDRIAG